MPKRIHITLLALLLLPLACSQKSDTEAGKEQAPTTVTICAMGEVDSCWLTLMGETLQASFKVEWKPGSAMDYPEGAYNASRNQYDAPTILKYIHKNQPPTEGVMVLVEGDLYREGRNYLFGYALMPGNISIMSLARLDGSAFGYQPTDAKTVPRIIKTTVHEFAHNLGSSHCQHDDTCVVSDTLGLKDLDNKQMNFCPTCERWICMVCGLEVEERRERMMKLFEKYGLKVEFSPLEED